ncbi:MAG: metal-dependent hydrolase [Acidimicrobiales bacterium]|jgi:L-ascorbate metabolism protein UlaG (beta-lactamase superfamily)
MTALKVEEELQTQSQSVGESGSLTWLGHATVLLTTAGGTRVVFDPWIEGNPKSPIDTEALGAVDIIAVTHGHFDHMGSVVPLAEATGATVVCVPEMAGYFASVGVANIVEMNKGGTVHLDGVSITMVAADHSCGVGMGENLPYAYGGNPVGFVTSLPPGEGGPVYVSGDTNVFGDMSLIRELYAPEIGLIPIDGHYNMGPREAAHAIWLLGLSRVVPIHYGTFPILTGTPDDLRSHLATAGSSTLTIALEPGQSVPLKA